MLDWTYILVRMHSCLHRFDQINPKKNNNIFLSLSLYLAFCIWFDRSEMIQPLLFLLLDFFSLWFDQVWPPWSLWCLSIAEREREKKRNEVQFLSLSSLIWSINIVKERSIECLSSIWGKYRRRIKRKEIISLLRHRAREREWCNNNQLRMCLLVYPWEDIKRKEGERNRKCD